MAKKKVRFSFMAPSNAREVRLCGDFTDWDAHAIHMRGGKSGEWTAIASVEPGEHQYKFWADGTWYTDPRADGQIHNNFGTENSVRYIS
jgi:1,4-alpha-glucan branching enzyme